MSDTVLYSLIMLAGVFIATVSQVMLKKAAMRTYDKWFKQYLNPMVIFAYVIMVASSLCSVVAYKVIPLSSAPVWNAAAQLFVVVLSLAVLGERPNKKKYIGLGVVLVGIVVFCL